MKSIPQLLRDAGFANADYIKHEAPHFDPKMWPKRASVFGTRPAESIEQGKDELKLKFRAVFVSGAMGGTPDNPRFYYVTSHVVGTMRRYRCRTWHDCEFNYVGTSGPTKRQAVLKWLEKWKEYKQKHNLCP